MVLYFFVFYVLGAIVVATVGGLRRSAENKKNIGFTTFFSNYFGKLIA